MIDLPHFFILIMNTLSKQELLDTIKKHNEEYRTGNPTISDSEYDSLVEQLKTIDPNNKWFNAHEPSPVSNSRKRKLPLPMKSLNKVKNINDVKKWLASLGLHDDSQLVLMPKLDGLSLLHNEKTGEGWSRGGAENEGQDCTEHCIAASIMSNTKYAYTYGEFIISRDSWGKFFEGKVSPYTQEKYKSPRNTAAGFLNRDVPCNEIQHASFFRYGLDVKSLEEFDTFEQVIKQLCCDYSQESLYKETTAQKITESSLLDLYKEWSKLYPIDGIVIYINNLQLWETIGRNQTTGNPLYAIAYKHPDFTDAFETTVKNVAWRASKAGALKPVVEIEAVNTGDCIMENPTGYNAGWIADMGIAPGAKILVTRSGGVIPKILQTLEAAPQTESEAMWDNLAECPHCGKPTSWNESHKELICTNPDCDGIRFAKIVFFFKICGVEDMGEQMFDKLYQAGFNTISSILNITANDILNIEGFAEGTANVILSNMEKIKTGVDLPTLMQASDCFPGIGTIKARKLIDNLPANEQSSLYNAGFFYDTDFIGNKIEQSKLETDKSFWRGFNKFHKFVAENDLAIKKPSVIEIDTNGMCAGMAVCFSGIRNTELEQRIIEAGGTIVSGVSKKTTHLVVKDVNAASSKITKAQGLGIAIMNIDDFIAQF